MARIRTTRPLLPTFLVCLLLAAPAPAASSPPDDDEGPPVEKARREGWEEAIIRLDTRFRPEGRISNRRNRRAQRRRIAEARAALLEDLEGTQFRETREYATVPYLGLLLSPHALREAEQSPHARAIVEDVPVPPSLSESVPLTQAPQMWSAGYTGAGQTVAVLDTGVDTGHPFLGGKVVAEECYSAGSDCPNRQPRQVGPGAGVPCSFSPDCNHGSHVAGIVAGSQGPTSGVAPGAKLLSIQVFSEFTGASMCGARASCGLSYVSDQLKALERVYLLRSSRSIAAVNMSLGSGRYTAPCDSDPLKPAIDSLRAAGIPTVVASGNDGWADAMAAPACISSAVSVGATTDAAPESVASFSNSTPFLSLLAPGTAITSSVPGGYATFHGTSMAAPHVAGAWALMKQRDAGASVASVLEALRSNGRPVPDQRNGVTVPAIRIRAAALETGPVPGTGHPRAISLRLRRHLWASGAVSVLDGFAECAQEVDVVIERKAGGWGAVRTTVTRPDGTYSVRLLDRPGKYRASAPQQGDCAAAVSRVRRHRHAGQ